MNDIIAAIATPIGVGGISIIKISGHDIISEIEALFPNVDFSKLQSHKLKHTKMIYQGKVIDELLISYMCAPYTFTGEDVVEINCHGGVVLTNQILDIVLSHNIRLAEPGEFSKRALLNGKLTFDKAETILELMNAKNDFSLSLVQSDMLGKNLEGIEKFRQKLIEIIAQIEVNIDYPEYEDIEELTNSLIAPKLVELIGEGQAILDDTKKGELFKNGIKTAIVGAPNVGKSSLFNALVKDDRAIVTNIAGTTRDIIETEINLGKIVLTLSDTAGLRQTDDIIEKIGIEKSYEAITKSELIIFVVDGSRELDASELELYKKIKHLKHIVIVNKNDLTQKIKLQVFEQYIQLSAHLDDINKQIEAEIIKQFKLEDFSVENSKYLSNQRQSGLLLKAVNALILANEGIVMGLPIDLVEIDLKDSLFALGEILGIEVKNDLINELFSRYCLGK
ncbi:MAG: tRNA uridine-5-carboxymethylaminomethyl(34) synthesis GTPase MnmE [Mycoplasmatales bacterium]